MNTSDTRDFDWYIDRLEVAKTNSSTPGKRDVHANCPACGGGDPLHLTEAADGAKVHCFACGAGRAKVAAALADAPAGIAKLAAKASQVAQKPPSRAPAVVATFPAYSVTGEHVADQLKTTGEPKYRWSVAGVKPSRLHGGLATVWHLGDDPVVLVEGHGPAKALNDSGIPAVCTVTGKASVIDAVGAAFLDGRRIILSPDKGGEAHMNACASVLSGIASVTLVAPGWPDGFPDNGDAADYIRLYGEPAMRDLYAAATPWVPTAVVAIPLSDIDRVDPEPLVDDFAHPHSHTALWGPSGAGKGVVAAWKAARRTIAGEPVLILDYEGHASEWRARMEDFGAVMDAVFIVSPVGLPSGTLKGALWDQADDIRALADALNISWVYVDSATAAVGVADLSASNQGPQPYFEALNRIGRPSVTLGHVTKAEDLKYPFGSQAWRAFVRMGWSFAGTGEKRDLVNRKTNDYPGQESVSFDWTWSDLLPPQRVPSTLTPTGRPTRSVVARALDAITATAAPMSKGDLLKAINEDGYGEVAAGTLDNRLSGNPAFERVAGQPGVWRATAIGEVAGQSGEKAGKKASSGTTRWGKSGEKAGKVSSIRTYRVGKERSSKLFPRVPPP